MVSRLRRELVARLPDSTLRRIQRLRHGESVRLSRPAGRRAAAGAVPEIVETYDAHAVRAEVAASVSETLERAGVSFTFVPGPSDLVREIAVSARDRAAALAAVEASFDGPGWMLRPGARARRTSATVGVHRVLAAPGGQPLAGTEPACAIAFSAEFHEGGVPRADGVARDLSSPIRQHAGDSSGRRPVDGPCPDIFEVREPVDVVYTWVDGSDPSWLERRSSHTPDAETAAALNSTATSMSRFLNRDELRYSMRSVAMYASWVRTIYLVTDGQVPEWLEPAHPKVVVVDHRDIFRDPSALPVFNSHAIESQLHHIHGLAESYLYLNDDVFFGRPVSPELFFFGNGVAKFLLAPDTTIDIAPRSVDDLPAIAAAKNLRSFLQTEFGVTLRRKAQHGPHPQQRSVLEELETRYPELFDRVSRSRFRHPDDYSIPSSLQHFYAFARGRAVPGEWSFIYQDIGRPSTPRRLDQILIERPQTFCLNDVHSTEDQLDDQRAALEEFFREYFPLPAPWER